MWLTQTYLTEPGRAFPVYSYFLFNPYTDWKSNSLQSIKNGLRSLGRETENRLSILFPDEAVDAKQIGEQLDQRFGQLIRNKIRLGTETKCGLLLLNKPLNELASDGSGADWVYFSFDEFIEPGGVTQDYFSMMKALADCSKESVATAGSGVRAMSNFLMAFQNISTKRARKRLLEVATMSGSGPSVSIAKVLSFFKSDSGIRTNMYN